MRARAPAGRLGARVAALLRTGTLVAVATVGAGFVVALVSADRGSGARPITDLIAGGGADALISVGLLGLTLLPLGVLGVAAATFQAEGERRYLLSSLATLGLLIAGLVTAALVSAAS